MYLVDTNVWLELLLEQEHANEVRNFFLSTDSRELAISDFALFSIGIILSRFEKNKILDEFLFDLYPTWALLSS